MAWQGEQWRDELGDVFAGLVPEHIDDRPLTGSIEGVTLGELGAFEVNGSPQTVRRTRAAVKRLPTDAVKVCVQLQGRAVVRQGEHELVIRPGQLGIYDTRRAYDLRLEGQWRCAVMVFPPNALRLPQRWIDGAMQHAHDIGSGPGAVLESFVRAALTQTADDPVHPGSALRFADAGLSLISSALTADAQIVLDEPGEQARKLAVLTYIDRHLLDPGLCHQSVATAFGMSVRSLDRLFGDETFTVTATIREMRLDGARRDLLADRTLRSTVGAVAGRWCFSDAAHFSRLYKSRFGRSPSTERAALR
ncbi:helix-turn-helix domain-containing protein [Rhodococcus sp. IEGM 1330]|uniref:AraC-like ligand-binding domain-containing protein n=1 Tax=Rhodococcus sp. IEGM 1330 TaxID=3082225 RepID=UPI0029533CBA|nr:helix-turn-helix domain-containing protein [Rhodococcus sp. IEGM 1330]MDV8021530.1 helix-turn-helix domain-containing protein [Rhodococcus sp. IEGM 1330]